MSDNVIPMPLRHTSKFEERRQSLSDQLRQQVRLSKSDRPIMASNLGRMAARFNEDNPISVIKSMFEIAWPGDNVKWAKRKRLVRVPGEDLGDPEDYGSYEAAGAPYLRLAHAIAKLSVPFEKDEHLKPEQDRRVAELLWRTSFRPTASSVDEATTDAKNLMVQLASTVVDQTNETGIRQLWDTLRISPFRKINLESAIKNRKFGKDIIPIIDADGEILNFHNAQEFGELFGLHLEWSRPRIFLGWLLRRFRADLLLPPENINLQLDAQWDPDDQNVKKLQAWAEEWADEDTKGKKEHLPSHYFDEDLSHGWVETDFDVVYRAYACLRPKGSNEVKITLEFEDGAGEDYGVLMLPSLCAEQLVQKNALSGYIYESMNEESYSYNDDGVLPGFFKHYISKHFDEKFHYWAADLLTKESISLSDRILAGRLLGFVFFQGGYKSISPPHSIDLTEIVDGEAAGILLGSRESYFVSELKEAVGAPVPCRANSLASSLLRNSILEFQECRLSDRLSKEAEYLAEEGLKFFNGVVDLYRRSIK